MGHLIKLLILSIMLIFSSCKDSNDYHQEKCSNLTDSIIFILFKDNAKSRSVALNIKNRSITFKGTTFNDLKWHINSSDIKSVTITDSNMLQMTTIKGKLHKFGIIDNECKLLVGKHVGKFTTN